MWKVKTKWVVYGFVRFLYLIPGETMYVPTDGCVDDIKDY